MNLYGRYLGWRTKENLKELPNVTIGDMLRVHEDEKERAHDLEIERQVDELLILEENNS